MNWPSIPPLIPRWLRRHPIALASVIGAVNRLKRLEKQHRGRVLLAILAAALLGALAAACLASARAAFALQWLLSYAGILVAFAGVYAASLISKYRRANEFARAGSWLAATPQVSSASSATAALSMILVLLWRLAVAVTFTYIFSLNEAVTVRQSLQLSALITIGAIFGALCGWGLSRNTATRGNVGSRYAPRSKPGTAFPAPSSAPLSHWPIAQAFAWGRPENTRLLLGAAILTIPGGSGFLGALFILVTWTVASYVVALLIAIPHVARSAAGWLRSTPITFWDFAWPLARRALLHHLCGAAIAVGVMLIVGVGALTAIYFGTLWMTLVVLAAVLGLADCYRARSPAVKTTMSILTVLLAEGRAHGWGISLALFLTVLHLRLGARHARA